MKQIHTIVGLRGEGILVKSHTHVHKQALTVCNLLVIGSVHNNYYLAEHIGYDRVCIQHSSVDYFIIVCTSIANGFLPTAFAAVVIVTVLGESANNHHIFIRLNVIGYFLQRSFESGGTRTHYSTTGSPASVVS